MWEDDIKSKHIDCSHPIRLPLSSKAKFGHDPVVGAFAVGPEEVAAAIEPAAADLGRRRTAHVPAKRILYKTNV